MRCQGWMGGGRRRVEVWTINARSVVYVGVDVTRCFSQAEPCSIQSRHYSLPTGDRPKTSTRVAYIFMLNRLISRDSSSLPGDLPPASPSSALPFRNPVCRSNM